MNIQVLTLLLFLLFQANAFGLKINQDVPDFIAINAEGKTWNSTNFKGKKNILLYFYPAAMTGGCTKQACAYRDHNEEWQKLEVEVVGISGDQPSNLILFKRSENLNFTLLSDPGGKVAKIFGVPFGKGGIIERFFKSDKYSLEREVTMKRWTFLISKNGKLLYKNDQVNALKDSENVFKFLKTRKL